MLQIDPTAHVILIGKPQSTSPLPSPYRNIYHTASSLAHARRVYVLT